MVDCMNTALAMMDDYRSRALKAEYELRRLRRAINSWEPLGVSLAIEDDEHTMVTFTATAKFPHDKAFAVADKLGLGEI